MPNEQKNEQKQGSKINVAWAMPHVGGGHSIHTLLGLTRELDRKVHEYVTGRRTPAAFSGIVGTVTTYTPPRLAPVPHTRWADDGDGGQLWAWFGLPATHPLHHAVFMHQEDAEAALAVFGSPISYVIHKEQGPALNAQLDP